MASEYPAIRAAGRSTGRRAADRRPANRRAAVRPAVTGGPGARHAGSAVGAVLAVVVLVATAGVRAVARRRATSAVGEPGPPVGPGDHAGPESPGSTADPERDLPGQVGSTQR